MKAISATSPTVRETGTAICLVDGGGAVRQSHSPAMAPNKIAAIWATEAVLNRMISAARLCHIGKSST
jgi:hypothetical protein